MIKHRPTRRALRSLAIHAIPGPLRASRCLAISGLPRSGTSWLAKVLSLADGVAYYFEPDHELEASYWYKYLGPNDTDVRLERHLNRWMRGRCHSHYSRAEQGLRELCRAPFAHTVMLKWVRFPGAMHWIGTQFPNLQIVQIVRHPIPQFLSWQTRDWDPGFTLQLLLTQADLMDGPLRAFRANMERAQTYWEKAAAFWGALARLQLDAHRDHWVFVEHEWLCQAPEERLRWLFGKLELDWNQEVAEFISPKRKRSSGPGYGARRDSRAEIHKWKSKIGADQMRQVASTLEPFDLPFYRDLEPEAFGAPDTRNFNA